MAKAGRPTEIDDELFLKIKELFLDGKNMREVAETLEIPYKTMEGWKTRNYKGFSDKMIEFRLERMFEKSINNIEVLQDSEDEKVNLQANSLVAETVGKKWFSKRSELTGAEGKDLIPDKQSKEKADSAIKSFFGK